VLPVLAPVSLYGVPHSVGEGAGIASADRLTRLTAARVTPRGKAQRRHLRRRAGQEHFKKTPGPVPRCPDRNRGQVLPGKARSAAVLNMPSSPHPIPAKFFCQIFWRNFRPRLVALKVTTLDSLRPW
jgi:hypothetical protein